MKLKYFATSIVVLGLILCVISSPIETNARIPANFLPIGAAVGSAPLIEATDQPQPITLSQSDPIATLDYGREVAGYPYFIVSSLVQPVQIEVRYTEQFDGLNHVWSDGPYVFATANGLANTFRVETFNVTAGGRFESFFIQGGQRWESIRLLTPGQITFREVGLRPTIDLENLDTLPGEFQCSDELYNSIWKLGANAVSAACVDAGTQQSTWRVTDQGAYIPGQQPGISAPNNNIEDYKLVFDTKIVRGGSGWAVANNVGSSGLRLLLISSLSPATTFVNTNETITPPHSIVLASGWNFVNQTTLPSYYLESFAVPFDVSEDLWYTVETVLSGGDYLAVSLAGEPVFNVSLSDRYGLTATGPPFGTSSLTQGSFGFGGWQDQVAYIKNVNVYANNGTLLYQNPMTSPEIIAEYGVDTNRASVCLDGAKRDRLVWLGDFFHTARMIPASTARNDFVTGTLEYVLDWQIANGQVHIAAPLGYDPKYAQLLSGGSYFLSDYQILGLLALTGYYERTGDLDFARRTWPAWKKQISWMLSQVDNSTHLAGIGGFIGPAYGTATSAALVEALNGASLIATALGDAIAADEYSSAADLIGAAVNKYLWNESSGTYALSNSSLGNFSVVGISFAITSGIANATQAKSALASLANLTLYPAYKDSTAANSSDPATNLSPFINGFLLSAAMQVNNPAPVKYLLDNLWAAMVTDNRYYSGASWEYVGQDLKPGLSLFTSLSHPWGGAPTYVLPEYVAGIRPVLAGYETWVIEPAYRGFDLDWARAKVQTRYGALSAGWVIDGSRLTVTVNAPKGTSGSLQLPGGQPLGQVSIDGLDQQAAGHIKLASGHHVVTICI